MTEKRPADIVSPITDIALPDKVSLADARSAARVGHDKPTSENSIVLLIDHQIGLMAGVCDFTSIAGRGYGVPGAAKNTGADVCLLPSPLWEGSGVGVGVGSPTATPTPLATRATLPKRGRVKSGARSLR